VGVGVYLSGLLIVQWDHTASQPTRSQRKRKRETTPSIPLPLQFIKAIARLMIIVAKFKIMTV
jgi:hypothetical protein